MHTIDVKQQLAELRATLMSLYPVARNVPPETDADRQRRLVDNQKLAEALRGSDRPTAGHVSRARSKRYNRTR